jgi:hypothetical protein
MACCDRGYDSPSRRPQVSDPATYFSSTPRVQPPAVARWHKPLHGLATAIEVPCSPPAADRESSKCKVFMPFYCSSLANLVPLEKRD